MTKQISVNICDLKIQKQDTVQTNVSANYITKKQTIMTHYTYTFTGCGKLGVIIEVNRKNDFFRICYLHYTYNRFVDFQFYGGDELIFTLNFQGPPNTLMLTQYYSALSMSELMIFS